MESKIKGRPFRQPRHMKSNESADQIAANSYHFFLLFRDASPALADYGTTGRP